MSFLEVVIFLMLDTKRNLYLCYDVQVARDATNGSEIGKSMAFYVLDALLAMDHHQVFLSQLQSRGLLHSCLSEISSNSYQVSCEFS